MKRVWSDYPLLCEHLALDGFEITEDRATADIIVSNQPIRDFRSLPRSAPANSLCSSTALYELPSAPSHLAHTDLTILCWLHCYLSAEVSACCDIARVLHVA